MTLTDHELEQRLRAALAAHAPGPDEVRAPRWEGVPADRGRAARSSLVRARLRLPVLVAAAALVVVALVVGVGLVVQGGAGDQPPAAPAGSVVPTPDPSRTVPAGSRAVSYRGVEVLVPAALRTSALQCGGREVVGGDDPASVPLGAGAVVVGPPSDPSECALATAAVVDAPFVRLLPDDAGEGAALAGRAAQVLTVNGSPVRVVCPSDATCTADRLDRASAVHVPERGVVVTATATAGSVVHDVLSSLRVVDRDAHGCATEASRAEGAPEGLPRADDAPLWTGEASRVTVCLYRGGVSEGGGTVDGAAARTAAELLAVPRPPLPDDADVCVDVPAPPFDVAGVRVELADGRVVTMTVQPAGCGPHVVVDAGDGPRTASPDGRETELLTNLRGRS